MISTRCDRCFYLVFGYFEEVPTQRNGEQCNSVQSEQRDKSARLIWRTRPPCSTKLPKTLKIVFRILYLPQRNAFPHKKVNRESPSISCRFQWLNQNQYRTPSAPGPINFTCLCNNSCHHLILILWIYTIFFVVVGPRRAHARPPKLHLFLENLLFSPVVNHRKSGISIHWVTACAPVCWPIVQTWLHGRHRNDHAKVSASSIRQEEASIVKWNAFRNTFKKGKRRKRIFALPTHSVW